ncbi:MBL fold metallo-hydrolase [Kribbella sp. NPDC051620]|uniref:MBL fold metallo-hydrolase n=1 Tax=Kribbella sp. NPDC051620 TaxID=3364120 RepID=UPI00378A581B
MITALLNGYLMPTDQGNPAFCAVYLIETPAGRVLFDCGHVGRRRALLTALSDHGLSPADVDAVVLSHGHWDHLQNADLFRRVLLHPAELRYLQDPAPEDLGTPRWAAGVLDGLEVDEVVDGHEVLPGVAVIELPGHTPGSIGLVVEQETAVLTGDAVPSAGVLVSGQPLGRSADAVRAEESIKRVVGLAGMVYPGHDRPFRINQY